MSRSLTHRHQIAIDTWAVCQANMRPKYDPWGLCDKHCLKFHNITIEERRARWRSDIADRTIVRKDLGDSSEQRSEHPKMKPYCKSDLFQGRWSFFLSTAMNTRWEVIEDCRICPRVANEIAPLSCSQSSHYTITRRLYRNSVILLIIKYMVYLSGLMNLMNWGPIIIRSTWWGSKVTWIHSKFRWN